MLTSSPIVGMHASTPLSFRCVRHLARGTWTSILSGLGIEVPAGGRHGPCPGCGGKDRFRFDDRDGLGTWFCNGGGSPEHGDGFDLVRHVTRGERVDALRSVAELVIAGASSLTVASRRTAPLPQRPAEGRRTYARDLWMRAHRDDCIVAAHPYVRRKQLEHAHGAGVVDGVTHSTWPHPERCLVIPIRSHGTGDVIAVQAITGDGRKVTFGSMTAPDGTPGYKLVGNDLDRSRRLFVVEGWADAVALAFMTYKGAACCAVAFGKGRLERVARQVWADLGREPVIIEDNDK